MAEPSALLLETLLKLANDGTTVLIISGRPKKFFLRFFPALSYRCVAEYGAFFWSHRAQKWEERLSENDFKEARASTLAIMKAFTSNIPGFLLRRRNVPLFSITARRIPTWHGSRRLSFERSWSKSSPDRCLTLRWERGPWKYGLSYVRKVRHFDWYLAQGKDSYDHLVTIGDERTDEEMYGIQSASNTSVYVGANDSRAKYKVQDVDQLTLFLDALSRRRAVPERGTEAEKYA